MVFGVFSVGGGGFGGGVASVFLGWGSRVGYSFYAVFFVLNIEVSEG